MKLLDLIGMHNRKSDGEDKPLESVTLGVFFHYIAIKTHHTYI